MLLIIPVVKRNIVLKVCLLVRNVIYLYCLTNYLQLFRNVTYLVIKFLICEINNFYLQRPLTRYLPIRSETLNLRNHIESAGHQIELCPHVSVDSTSCRGYLQKMGSKFHHWNKRWFVFDRTKRLFSYYSDRSEKKHRGGAYFQVITLVFCNGTL